jgi:chemotaxis protein CheD
MRHIIGVADMKISDRRGDQLVTHALGSCVGITIHDEQACVGGILHYMLPMSAIDPDKAAANPLMFGDTGIPFLFEEAYRKGARKERMRVVMAGGAQVLGDINDTFAIGKRNVVIARKLFWKNNVLIAAEQVGGSIPRTLSLDIGPGTTLVSSRGERVSL